MPKKNLGLGKAHVERPPQKRRGQRIEKVPISHVMRSIWPATTSGSSFDAGKINGVRSLYFRSNKTINQLREDFNNYRSHKGFTGLTSRE